MRARMMWMVVLAVAIITAACGDSKSSFLPTAPSALPTSVASVDAGTADAGYSTTANGNGNGNGRKPSISTDSGERVIVEGLIDAKGDDYTILVGGRLITVTSATLIRRGDVRFQFSDLREKDRVHVTANRLGSVYEAVEIKLQNPGEGEVEPPPPPPPPDPQVVSVTALDAEAFEAGGVNGPDPGTFQLTRTTSTQAQLDAELQVTFMLGGSASPGDYQPVNLTATFPGGAHTVDVVVTPVADTILNESETVELTVQAGDGYTVGTSPTAVVTINEMAPAFVNVRATDTDAVEGGLPPTGNFGVFEITRTGNLGAPLTVTLQFSGTAQLSDFKFANVQLTSTTLQIPFAINQAVRTFQLTANADGVVEAEEIVVLSAAPGAGYAVGTSGTVRILGQQ